MREEDKGSEALSPISWCLEGAYDFDCTPASQYSRKNLHLLL